MTQEARSLQDKPDILIIETDTENRVALMRLLLEESANLVECSSPEQVAGLLKERKPALIILAARLGDHDGYTVLNQIQASEEGQDIPVILLINHLSDPASLLHQDVTRGVVLHPRPLAIPYFINDVRNLLHQHNYHQMVSELYAQAEQKLALKAEGVLGIDSHGIIRYASVSAARLLQSTPTRLMGCYAESLFEEPNDHVLSSWALHPVKQACDNGNILHVKQSEFWTADGKAISVTFAAIPLLTANRHLPESFPKLEVLVAFKPRSGRDEARARLAELSHRDTATGLPNRRGFEDALGNAMNRAGQRKTSLALYTINLDHFRYVNESLGHDMGDHLIRQVAQRISGTGIQWHAGRFDGDEFGVFVEAVTSSKQASAIAHQLFNRLREPYLANGHEVHLTASIGVALYPQCGTTVDGLMSAAATAMERGKALGRATIQFYSAEMNRQNILRMELEQDLFKAISQGEMKVVYQAVERISGAGDGQSPLQYVAAELAWEHPVRGVLGWSTFRSVAEDAGLAVDLNCWLIGQALQQCKKMSEAEPAFKMVLPLEPALLLKMDVASFLKERLEACGVPISRIGLAIMESEILNRFQDFQEKLMQLTEAGFGVVVNDFAAGNGALNLLRTLPVDYVKIDRRFTADLDKNPKDAAIVTGVITMGKGIGIGVCVDRQPGTSQQSLQAIGCDFVQQPTPLESGQIIETYFSP